jgi:hypothetical protein
MDSEDSWGSNMSWRSSEIIGYGIEATDGSIGSIDDLLFDDITWTLRWAVIDTGTWLPGRKVLLPPSVMGPPTLATRTFPVDLPRERIKASPSRDSDAPVSRQLESEIYDHYDWLPYWTGGYGHPGFIRCGVGPAAAPLPPLGSGRRATASRPAAEAEAAVAEQRRREGDPHLRSVNEVTGYYVEATDGNIGHIDEFMVENGSWIIRYLLVDTKNWWPGRKVLISPHWASQISWSERQVRLEVDREKVKSSPEYDPSAPIERHYEERLHAHYGYPVYWHMGAP